MAQPGVKMTAGAEPDGNLPTSRIGREQMLDALKTAFVQGRLTKDEFDLRVGQVLAAYAELDSAIADIPGGLALARSPEPVPKSHNKKLIQRGTAAGTAASVALAATVAVAARGNPVLSVVVVGLVGVAVAVLLSGLLTLLSWVLGSISSGQAPQGAPPAVSGKAPQRLTSADPAGSSLRMSRNGWHTIEAVRRRLPGLRLSSAVGEIG
jgi:hypothetical protein